VFHTDGRARRVTLVGVLVDEGHILAAASTQAAILKMMTALFYDLDNVHAERKLAKECMRDSVSD